MSLKPVLRLASVCLAIAPAVAFAQTAPQPSAAATAAGGSATPPAASTDQNTNPDTSQAPLQLTPFEVNATQDHGYFAPQTLAGTRLNNNIADIPSSVTVVTKQEMLDTNSWNINDVFEYQSNTEGASTYTPTSLVRSNVADVLGGGGGSGASALASGNRVRGLQTADQEMDDFPSINRIPFDAYNTQSVEIDRGPNSILFGTGSPAGIVNQSRTQAVLDKTDGTASLTAGSWGTLRATLGLNFAIIPDKLSIYLADDYTYVGFKQKPSSDYTRRQYGTLTFVPFANHKTKITASFEEYNNSSNDPNYVTPVDLVTPWLQSGRPVYNPLNDMVTYLSTGKQVGPYALSTTSPNYSGILQSSLIISTSPYFVPGLTYDSSHQIQGINPTGSQLFFYKAQQTGFSVSGFVPTTLTASQALVNEEKMTFSTNLPLPAQYQIWYIPSVSSKSIYDWSTVNVDSMNFQQMFAQIYHADLQQEILPGLNFDLSWFREQLHQFTDDPVSQANATTMYVDTNQYLLDGRTNPNLGNVLVQTYQSDEFQLPEINNNWRASLEYELHLEDKVPDWLKFLGHHRFMAVFTQHDDIQTALRYRPSIVGGDPNYLPTTAAFTSATGYSYPSSNANFEQLYYFPGGNGYASGPASSVRRVGDGGPSNLNIETYNYANNAWQTSQINMASVLFPSGGLSENLQDIKTYFWESFFWNDRIVGIVGIDDDQVKNRQTVFPTTNPTLAEYTNGYPNNPLWYNEGPWTDVGGNTSNLGATFHPFKNWGAIDSAANSGNLFAGFARTLAFTFNKSANFNPPSSFLTDFYGNPLPKPEGQEKDYGLEIATPDNKFFLRATWYNTQNLNAAISNTSNARALYIDQTELHNWATAVVEVRNGELPSDPNFGNTSVYPITTAEQTQIAALTGLPYNFGGNVGTQGQFINPGETENQYSHGVELEAEYNPFRNWRMKFAWGYQKSILSNIAQQASTYVNARYPVWQTYTAPDLSQVYTKSNGTPMYLGNFWQAYNYDSNVTGAGNANGWVNTQAYYNLVVGAQLATDTALNGTQATNQRDYSWAYTTTYDFDWGPLKGWGIGGSLRYLGNAIAGYYGNTNTLSPTGQVFEPAVNEPIIFPHQWHVDAWLMYHFKMPWSDGRIRGTVQLNCRDLNISSYLQPIQYNFDGSPSAERIIQPRSYQLTTRFEF